MSSQWVDSGRARHAWCECGAKLLPVGAFAVYQDGVTHSPEGCEVDT